MNLVVLNGNLARDGELKVTASGKNVLKFDVATNYRVKNASGEYENKADFHRCTLFGDRAAKVAQFLTKGKKVLVTGRISYSKYEKDGETKFSTDIIVLDVELGGEAKAVATAAPDGGDYPESWDTNG